MNIEAVHLSSTPQASARRECQLCRMPLEHSFVDLGMSPLCESILALPQLDEMEVLFSSPCLRSASTASSCNSGNM